MHSEGEDGNSKGGGEERQQRRNHQHRQKGTLKKTTHIVLTGCVKYRHVQGKTFAVVY